MCLVFTIVHDDVSPLSICVDGGIKGDYGPPTTATLSGGDFTVMITGSS